MPIVVSGGLLVSTDGWPLTYPAWFSTLDRRRIDDALSAAAASATLPATPDVAPTRALTGPLHGRLFASEGAAVEGVLQVFTVVVRVLSEPRDGPPDEDTRRQVANRLFDELVVWIADLTPSVTDDFATGVREARATCAWWTTFTRSTDDSAAEPRDGGDTRSTDNSPLLTLKEAAKQLRLTPKTLKGMAAKGELNIVRLSERKLGVRQSEVNRLLAQHKFRYR